MKKNKNKKHHQEAYDEPEGSYMELLESLDNSRQKRREKRFQRALKTKNIDELMELDDINEWGV